MAESSTAKWILKPPIGRTVVLALVGAVFVHTLFWLSVQSLVGLGFYDALSAAQGQAFLCLTWLIAALCLWALKPPTSRLGATLSILGVAAFVTILGSVAGYLRLMWGQFGQEGRNLLSFLLFGLAMSLVHVAMALPSAMVFRHLCLIEQKPSVAP